MDRRGGNERTTGELYGDKEGFRVDKKFRAAVQLDGEYNHLKMHSIAIEAERVDDKFSSDRGMKINFPPRTGSKAKVCTTTRPVSHTTYSGPIKFTRNKHPLSDAPRSDMSTRHSFLPSEAVTPIHSFGVADEMHRMEKTLAIAPSDRQQHSEPQLLDKQVQSLQQRYHQDWQLFYAQHRQWMFPQQQHDPFFTHAGLVATQTSSSVHPVVIIPVPLPIVNEVAQYVSEYMLLEQQQSHAVHEAKHLHLKHPDQRRALCCIDSISDAVVVESKVPLVSTERSEEEHVHNDDPDERQYSREMRSPRNDAEQVEVAEDVGSNRPEAMESRPLCDPKSSVISSFLLAVTSAQPACQESPLSAETALDPYEQSRQNENQVQHLRNTTEGKLPLEPHTISRVAATPELAAIGVRTKNPGVEKSKRSRKCRRKSSAAEEARLAACHPAAPYITTIGPNLSANKSSSGGAGGDAEAWRQQVRYHWHGTLLFDPERCMQVWRGSWLGIAHAAALNFSAIRGPSGSKRAGDFKQHSEVPTIEAFEVTETTFEYVSRKIRKHNLPESAQDSHVVPQTGYFKGYFKMRSTKVKAYVKHNDHDFYIVFEPYAPGKDGLVHEYALYGRGMGEYGAFIVHGRYSNQTGLMQAVRVYLHENDDRAKMTLKQLQAWFQQGGNI
eukprot:gene18318-20857_t